jgi:hypothetical protein
MFVVLLPVRHMYGRSVSQRSILVVSIEPLRGVLCVKFCKGGHVGVGLGGLAQLGFLVLLEIVHVEVSMGFEPVLVRLDG